MTELVFFAFIIVYAVLILSHKTRNLRAYKMFWFGLLISVLYASIYSFFPDPALVYILILTTVAITSQCVYWYAIETGEIKPPKNMVVNIEPKHKLTPLKRTRKR